MFVESKDVLNALQVLASQLGDAAERDDVGRQSERSEGRKDRRSVRGKVKTTVCSRCRAGVVLYSTRTWRLARATRWQGYSNWSWK